MQRNWRPASCSGRVDSVETAVLLVLAVVWPLTGVLSGILMVRRGYDPLWILVALPLGLLFLPIALERIRRRPAVAAFGQTGEPPRRNTQASGTRVLVGLDGSEHSDRALETVLRLFGTQCGLLVLAEVVSFDATEGVTTAAVDDASRRLTDIAAGLTFGGDVHTEVLTGPPGPALTRFAEQQDMDLLVAGRRGKGKSTGLLGSASTYLVEHSPVPVLVVEPTP